MRTMTENDGNRPWWAFGCTGAMTPADVRNLGLFNLFLLLWAVAYLGATFLLAEELVPKGAAAVAVALAPTVLLALAVAAYLRFLRQTDELLRKIHLEGLALGFGAGAVFALGYRLLERAGAPKLDVSDSMLAAALFWSLGVWLAQRRYA